MSELIYARERGIRQSDSKAQVYVIPTGKKDEIFNSARHKVSPIYDLEASLAENGFKVVKRNAAIEDDSWKQQLVVGLVIRVGASLILMECKKGGMEGNLTLVEGHVNPMDGFESRPLGDILASEINREFNEEINYKKSPEKLVVRRNMLKFVTEDNYNLSSISYKHIGFIYEIDASFVSKFSSAEPDINEVYVFDLRKGNVTMCDSWVKEIVAYYRFKLGIV